MWGQKYQSNEEEVEAAQNVLTIAATREELVAVPCRPAVAHNK